MQSMRLRVGARAAVLALILGMLARVGSAHAAEAPGGACQAAFVHSANQRGHRIEAIHLSAIVPG